MPFNRFVLTTTLILAGLIAVTTAQTTPQPRSCQNDGVIVGRDRYPKCHCSPGFKGYDCSLRVTPCEASPCRNGGSCSENRDGTFTCNCTALYNGILCEHPVQPCDSGPCKNGGNCTDDGIKCFQCECPPGFKGPDCSKIVQPCEIKPCKNNGTCVNNKGGKFTCKCNKGFGGTFCDRRVQSTTSKPTLSTATPIKGKSCSSLYKSGQRKDGVYTINPDGLGSFQVRCDMQTDGGGWTVFQRRQDASVDFYRGWQDYKNGFGDLNSNFWLGLDRIHRLSKSGQNVLRVDLMDWTNDTAYAKYGSFSVASESNGYRLNLGSYSGNAGDSLKYHNGMKFTTYDRDNDQWGSNCAVNGQGAWWYQSCHHSNLNGRYFKAGETASVKGVNWFFWKKDYTSMKKTEMKIRPAVF